jgi:hypothetical protein
MDKGCDNKRRVSASVLLKRTRGFGEEEGK